MNNLLETYLHKLQEDYESASSTFSSFMQCVGWNPKCKQIKLKKQSDWDSCSKIKDHKQNWFCTSNALINYHKACISILQSDAVKYCNSNKDPKECNTQRIKAIKEHQYEIQKIIADRKINIGESHSLLENITTYRTELSKFRDKWDEETTNKEHSTCEPISKKANELLRKYNLTYDDYKKYPADVKNLLKQYNECRVKIRTSQFSKLLSWFRYAENTICKGNPKCIKQAKEDYISYKEHINKIGS